MHYTTKIYPKTLFAFFLVLLFSSFQTLPENQFELDENNTSSKRLVTLRSYEFQTFSNSIYRKLNFDDDTLSKEVFEHAFRGYMFLKQTGQIENDQYLTIIDFNQHCCSKRLWVLDLKENNVILNEMVAHGARSGTEYATQFSNAHSSNKSSLGFYSTGDTYWGRNGLSLKLHGLEKSYNDNAYTRGIVIHGASYVGEDYLKYNDRIGRSYGCPAVSQSINKYLINTIKGGTCLFIYHENDQYKQNSQFMAANLYIPVDELSL